MNPQRFTELFALTFRDPAAAMAELRKLDLSMESRWMLLLLTVSLNTLLTGFVNSVLMPLPDDVMLGAFRQPLFIAALQFVALALSAGLIAWVGRLFGGEGDFPDALLVMGWFELVIFVIQAVGVVIVLILPPFGGVFFLLTVAAAIYLSVGLIRALHGFSNSLLVLFGMMGTMFVVAVILSILGLALGILPEMPNQ